MLAGSKLVLVDVHLWHAVDADGAGELWLCLTVTLAVASVSNFGALAYFIWSSRK